MTLVVRDKARESKILEKASEEVKGELSLDEH